MTDGVFISYRRSDSAAYAGRIADYFARAHAQFDVFMDVNAIRPGEDFMAAIEGRLASASAVLALIGDRWLDAATPSGTYRLDDPGDFVRLELSLALQRNARVIPILLDEAAMPTAANLPKPLQLLAKRNAFSIRHGSFDRDVQELARLLEVPLSAPLANTSVLGGRTVPATVLDPLVADFKKYIGAEDHALFMIVEDEAERFVQFIGVENGEVMLDLPSQALTPEQIVAARRFLSESYQVETQDIDGEHFSFQTFVPTDARYLALLTLEVFDHVYGAPPSQPLSVTIDS